jgi:LPXTG-motif cell wall-anchored protein
MAVDHLPKIALPLLELAGLLGLAAAALLFRRRRRVAANARWRGLVTSSSLQQPRLAHPPPPFLSLCVWRC